MRKVCRNHVKENGLETVLEIPIPEEIFSSTGSKSKTKRLSSHANPWVKFPPVKSCSLSPIDGRCADLQLILGVAGAPLVPIAVTKPDNAISIKEDPIEVSMAKYIVRQYVANIGGEYAIGRIESMYAMGKVRMTSSEMPVVNKKGAKGGEVGGFVLWQMKPDLWCLELLVSGCKIGAGSDGKVAWRHTPWHPPQASRGPPRPLRRALQGLDPRSTANLFLNATCIGEKLINGEETFVLRLDADASALRSRSTNNVEILRHTIWGYFSHRTGLLIQLDDTHLLCMKVPNEETASFYWETTMETTIEDYRPIDGVYIAHSGRTTILLLRFGDTVEDNKKTKMEETWSVVEVEFNIRDLSTDCFLPPADIVFPEKEASLSPADRQRSLDRRQFPTKNLMGSGRFGLSKIVAVDCDDDDGDENDDHKQD